MSHSEGGVVSCIGLAPMHWYPDSGKGEYKYPPSITLPLLISVVFSVQLLMYWREEKASRFVQSKSFFGGEKPSRKEFLQLDDSETVPRYPGVPAINIGIWIILGGYVFGSVLDGILFWTFTGVGSATSNSIACSLQHYAIGDWLYGCGVGALGTTVLSTMLIMVSWRGRPKMAQNAAKTIVQGLISVETYKKLIRTATSDKRGDVVEELSILAPDAGDGLRVFKAIKDLHEVRMADPSIFPEFTVTYADKYGHGPDQVKLDELCIERFAKIEGIDSLVSSLNIPAMEDLREDDRFKLPDEVKGTYDYIINTDYNLVDSQSLGTAHGDASNESSKNQMRNRLRAFFVEMVCALKPNGNSYMLVPVQNDAKRLEYIREVMSEAGWDTTVIDHGRIMKKIFGMELFEVKTWNIVARPKSSLHVEEDIRSSIALANKAGEIAAGHVETYDEDEVILNPSQVYFHFICWQVIHVLGFIGLFVFMVNGWETLMVPSTGYPNYLALQVMSIVTGFPWNMLLLGFYENHLFSSMTRPTSKKLFTTGFYIALGLIILSTIQSLPGWLIDTFISFYFLDKVFHIDVDTIENHHICLAIKIILGYSIIRIYTYYSKTVTSIDDDKLEKYMGKSLHTIGSVSISDIYTTNDNIDGSGLASLSSGGGNARSTREDRAAANAKFVERASLASSRSSFTALSNPSIPPLATKNPLTTSSGDGDTTEL